MDAGAGPVIAWLEGRLREKGPTRVVVDVQGVGYELAIPLSSFEALPECGKNVALYVTTIVREDAISLFGFASAAEREVFELLLRANRVGPKLAQTILSGLSADRIVRALRDGDLQALRGAPGVGPKLAERIHFELKDRAAELVDSSGGILAGAPSDAPDPISLHDEVLSALLNLGYPRPQASKVVEAVAAEAGEGAGLETWIRIALRRLAR